MAGLNEWYHEGLSFECTQCGSCCTGAPGYVWVSPVEVERLADGLSLTVEAFGSQYLRYVRNRFSLVERSNGDCVFWDSKVGCQVYDSRPDQCRSWPFWHGNIDTKASWEATAEHCPGCNRGRTWDLIEIGQMLKRSPDRSNWPEQ